MGECWSASGLIFENCNCTVICPGHVHFSQNCTNEACIGYWALDFRKGGIDGVDLAGMRAVVVFSAPQRMIDGGWRQVIVFDADAPVEKREKVESILKGERGGPWAVLGRFVAVRLPTILGKIEFAEEGRKKSVKIDGYLESTVEAIPGKNKTEFVKLENMFNQIHAPSQVIARSSTVSTIEGLSFTTELTHGLWSDFDWSVSAG